MKVTLVVSATNQGVVPLLPQVDCHFPIPLYRPITALRKLRAQRFDLLIDANQWVRISAVYCALTGAYSIGFRTPGQHRHFAYTTTVPHSVDRHELENFRAFLAQLDLQCRSLPLVEVDEAARVRAAPNIPAGPFTVFHLWTRGRHPELKE